MSQLIPCGTDIPVRYSHNNLGIILTSDLSWTNHYDYVLAKVYGSSA